MQDETWTFEPHDLDRLIDVISSYSEPSSIGFNAFIEPEPTSTKGRFGRTKERSTGYAIGLMHSPEPAGLMMQINTPDGNVAGMPTQPEGWAEHPESGGDVIVYPGAPDARQTATWIIEALPALGAPFPTGKFRGYDPGTVSRQYYNS